MRARVQANCHPSQPWASINFRLQSVWHLRHERRQRYSDNFGGRVHHLQQQGLQYRDWHAHQSQHCALFSHFNMNSELLLVGRRANRVDHVFLLAFLSGRSRSAPEIETTTFGPLVFKTERNLIPTE